MVGLDLLRLSSLKFRGTFLALQLSEFSCPENLPAFPKGGNHFNRIEYPDLQNQVGSAGHIAI